MARPIWEGAISFGLINIGVSLKSVISSRSLDLDMLDKRDHSPIGYKRYNKVTGDEVDMDDVVKGYEYEKGHYVLISDEDFKRANPKKTQQIEIVSFVKEEDIDPIFFDKPYRLTPDKKSGKSFNLLRDALIATKKVAIGRMVLRTREYLVAVMPHESGMVLEVLRYAHEIRDDKEDRKEVKATGTAPTVKERKLAEQLINQLSEKWNPKKFTDTYYDDMMALIQKRIDEGKTEVIDESKVEDEHWSAPTSTKDIMSLLKKSLSKNSGGSSKDSGAKRPRPNASRKYKKAA